MDQLGQTHRWVAGAGDARSAARAIFRANRGRARVWVYLFAVLIWVTGVLSVSSTPARYVVGTAYALLLLVAAQGGSYAGLVRRTSRQIPLGTVLESEFGEDFVVLRRPAIETRLAFSTIESIRPLGRWVLIRQQPSSLHSCWPVELFPGPELSRIRRHVGTRGPV